MPELRTVLYTLGEEMMRDRSDVETHMVTTENKRQRKWQKNNRKQKKHSELKRPRRQLFLFQSKV